MQLLTTAARGGARIAYRDLVMATKIVLHSLARRLLELYHEIADRPAHQPPLVESSAPRCSSCRRRGGRAHQFPVGSATSTDSAASPCRRCFALSPSSRIVGKTVRHNGQPRPRPRCRAAGPAPVEGLEGRIELVDPAFEYLKIFTGNASQRPDVLTPVEFENHPEHSVVP